MFIYDNLLWDINVKNVDLKWSFYYTVRICVLRTTYEQRQMYKRITLLKWYFELNTSLDELLWSSKCGIFICLYWIRVHSISSTWEFFILEDFCENVPNLTDVRILKSIFTRLILTESTLNCINTQTTRLKLTNFKKYRIKVENCKNYRDQQCDLVSKVLNCKQPCSEKKELTGFRSIHM